MITANLFSDDQLMTFIAGLGLLALFFWYFATDFERKKRNIGTIIVALIAVFSFLSIIPQNKWADVLTGKSSLKDANTLKGGIDLVGGSSFTLSVQPNIDPGTGKPQPMSEEAVQQAIKTIEGRLNAFGTSDLQIVAQGKSRILVQMPGISPEAAAEVRKTLEDVAKLEITLVHPDSRTLADKVAADPENEIVPGYELKAYHSFDENNKATSENLLIKKRAPLDGSYVVFAQERYDTAGHLNVELNKDGGKIMRDMTSKMRPGIDRLAITLDGEVLNASSTEGTLGANFLIRGLDTTERARSLAAALMNPLQNPLNVDEERSVSATLGKETITQGVTAGIAGLGLTLIFVLLYYRFAGLIALVGLSFNIIVLFGTMAMFGFTFTLPGIAGIILTIGVAVDANVLIYERLREELANGKSIKAAIAAAYDKAFSAIFDANITTLLTAVILFWRASGTVKGFAITLTLGILASMLAALICTRILFWWASDTGVLKNLKFMNLIPKRAFDFLAKRKISLSLSAVLILFAVAEIGIQGKENLGIDFTGGAQLSIQLDKEVKIDSSDADKILSGLDLTKNAIAQEETNTTGNLLTVRCANDDVETIKAALQSAFPALQEKITTDNGSQDKYQISTSTISSSLGGEFLSNAVWALLIGLFAILTYITVRFEFSFALGAFAALFHDILICLGFIILKGDELSLIHVGAFLTIAGYSINDTIVVFDRIREDLRTRRGEVEDIMNQAINTTLSRTVLTSITTFVAVLVLYIFGGAALKDFSFSIMIGVIVGTYSSIFIASPIVYLWSKMRGSNLRRELLDANLEAEVLPAKPSN